ncbi:MAG TPA: hypothetical protein VJP60_02560, partial [Rhizomicrobium sp.]|nr:hypothetical protein [Rhizomicrobium sp.]
GRLLHMEANVSHDLFRKLDPSAICVPPILWARRAAGARGRFWPATATSIWTTSPSPARPAAASRAASSMSGQSA